MPHVLIDCSANVADHVDVDDLVDRVHDCVLATGIATVDALRTRADVRCHYAVADRAPTNMYVAVTVRLGPGRTIDEQQRLLEAVADAVDGCFGDARRHLMVSVECQEIDAGRRLNRNHLRTTRGGAIEPGAP